MSPRLLALLTAAVLAVGAVLGAAPTEAATPVALSQGCLLSVPEPGSSTPVKICYTLFKPVSASARRPVPFLLHSHGWGGQRTRTTLPFATYLRAGYGMLSFDQRGFGESGGKAHLANPDIEGKDVQRVVDLIARLSWVKKEDRAGKDPVLGAIGGSYGGAYQFVGAFSELRDRGATRFDALAPEITWNDLRSALGPARVGRSTWLGKLVNAGLDHQDDRFPRGYAYLAATGLWPGATVPGGDWDALFARSGPAWFAAQGLRLDIPLLLRQGMNDSLFNLNEAVANFDRTMTPRARARSILIGYNGGHTLPASVPRSTSVNGDPCSARLSGGTLSYSEVARRFFSENLLGKRAGLTGQGRYHLATSDGRECLTLRSLAPTRSVSLSKVATSSAAGGPVHHLLLRGPLTVGGIARVSAAVTSLGAENRVFLALSVGSSAADALVVQNNVMPLRESGPVVGRTRTFDLPGIAVRVPKGKNLYLTVSPLSDGSPATGSRAPGGIVLDRVVVRVPVVP